MTRTDINFLDEKNKIVKRPKRKLHFISKLILYLLVIFVILGISSGIGVLSSSENLAKTLGNIGLWEQIKQLFSGDNKKLAGEAQDRINILLLGIGGGDHEGPYLSDTNIIVSFKPSTKQVALISVPRDLQAPIPGWGWTKINHADAYGEVKNPGQGGEFARQVFSEVFNLPIHYYVRVDFSGFKQIIDDLGGVTINVENTLDDYMYPVKGKEMATTTERYEYLHIDKGLQRMDGDLALKYVRSRHAQSAEGSDFARSRRQQLLLMAVKDKGLSFSTLVNPYKVSRVMETLSQHVATNFQVWEIIRMFNLGKDVKEENITRLVFDASPDGFLGEAVGADGAFLLQPKTGNYSVMQEAVNNIFVALAAENNIAAATKKEEPKIIEIKNGTKVSGLALKVSQYLQGLNYEVTKIGNAPTQDYQKTVIYDLKQTDSPIITRLAELLNSEIAAAVPAWVTATGSPVDPQTDILIILGQNSKNL